MRCTDLEMGMLLRQLYNLPEERRLAKERESKAVDPSN
jgi:hypothetical protein